ncbi:polysaccharide deacetylase family protein [Sphingomonas sp. BN140010]|uniref:Chitooligosaccharide deacetylase n=1 Tax=Sphingomonas arvum TaxID=2992113 RepID=A0ABT3JFY4_9SPHN|nr:polysaccharide deacetylase family protein [Sphingomonas sp. BN140010]MCW3797993.1 polysaccharide deacetylase family protein [Sphingomonas sp. BN140010]
MTKPLWTRRTLLGALGATSVAGCAGLRGRANGNSRRSLAVTIDDFDIVDGPLLSADQREAAVLAALDHHRVRACGFPKAKSVADPAGGKRLARWVERGHQVGCHSYAHAFYSGKDPASFAADLDRALPLVSGLPTSVPLFRFPYLAEGRTREGRDAARAALGARGLRNGHVSIDTSDWYIAARLTKRLKRDPAADLAPWRRFYIAHVLDRAAYYDRMAREVLGRSMSHTLLVHHNLAAALFLGDALQAFRQAGWQLVDAALAFGDPVFRARPDIVPAGQSIVWQLAKESGRFEERLRYPAEDGDYEQPALDAVVGAEPTPT